MKRLKNMVSLIALASFIPNVSLAFCEASLTDDPTGNAYAEMVLAGEGGGNWSATNPDSTATGAFQFMYDTLRDLGYVSQDSRRVGSDMYGSGEWSGVTWTGLDGVTSRQDFMSNQAVQISALRRFTERNLEIIQPDYTTSANGVPLTPGGVGYASHFLGHGGFKQWRSCGYQASCLPSNILAQNASFGSLQGINDMLMERMAEGAGVDPSCINPGEYEGEIPAIFLMPWDV